MLPLKLPIVCPVSGVSFKQDEVSGVRLTDRVVVEREPNNEHDVTACRVICSGVHVGYIPKNIAKRLCANTNSKYWTGTVLEILKGEQLTGLRVRIVESVGYSVDHQDLEQIEQTEQTISTTVYTRSGRVLGTLDALDGEKVIVLTTQGTKVPYPAALVTYKLLVDN
jgi:hypothetical protein